MPATIPLPPKNEPRTLRERMSHPGLLLAAAALTAFSLHAQNPGSYNAANAKPQTPAEQLAAFTLPEGFDEMNAAEIESMFAAGR